MSTPGGTTQYEVVHGSVKTMVLFCDVGRYGFDEGFGDGRDGLSVAVGDAVFELDCVMVGVTGGKQATCTTSLHSPGCSTPPTQHAQQMDAVALVAQGVQSKPCALAQSSASATRRATAMLAKAGADTRRVESPVAIALSRACSAM